MSLVINPLKPSGAKWSHLKASRAILVERTIFLIFDIRALWRSGLSARAPECQKLKNGGFDQYGPGRFGGLILLYSQKNAGLKGLIPLQSVAYVTFRSLLSDPLTFVQTFNENPSIGEFVKHERQSSNFDRLYGLPAAVCLQNF